MTRKSRGRRKPVAPIGLCSWEHAGLQNRRARFDSSTTRAGRKRGFDSLTEAGDRVGSSKGRTPPTTSSGECRQWSQTGSEPPGCRRSARSSILPLSSQWPCRLLARSAAPQAVGPGSIPGRATSTASSSSAKDTRLSSGQLGFKSRCGDHAPGHWKTPMATNQGREVRILFGVRDAGALGASTRPS